MGRVVVVGSLTIDLVTHVESHPKSGETVRGAGLERLAGGKGANQAVAAVMAGAEVVMVGCVGPDEAGSAYVARLLALGIDVASMREATGRPTGHALVVIDDAGENSIVVVAGANAALTVGAAWDGDQVNGPVVEGPDVLDTSGAGDAFCGPLCAALLAGAGRREAMRSALAGGAEAVRHVGAQRNPPL